MRNRQQSNPTSQLGNNQNFSVQVSVDSATRPRGYFVAFFFELVSVLSAFALGYQYFRYLTQSTVMPTLTLLEVLWIGIPFTLAHVMSFLLVKSRQRRFAVLVLETAALMFFFGGFPNLKWIYFGAITLAVFFFLWIGEHEAHAEMENAIKFKFLKVTGPLIAKTMSALVLMGVLLSLPQLQNDQGFFRGQQFSNFPGWGIKIAQRFFPGLSEDTTALSLAKKVAEIQLSKNENFAKLTPNAREAAVNQAATELIKTLSVSSTTVQTEDVSLGTITTQFLNSQLRIWYEKAPVTFLFIWALVLFFIFRGFGAIFGFVIGSMGFVIYQILIAMNIIHLTGESRLHEMIEYS